MMGRYSCIQDLTITPTPWPIKLNRAQSLLLSSSVYKKLRSVWVNFHAHTKFKLMRALQNQVAQILTVKVREEEKYAVVLSRSQSSDN